MWGKEAADEGNLNKGVGAGGEGVERRYRTGSVSERANGKLLRWNLEVEAHQTAQTGEEMGRSKGLREGSPARVG